MASQWQSIWNITTVCNVKVDVAQDDIYQCFKPILTYKHIKLLYTVAWSYAVPSMPNSDAPSRFPGLSSSLPPSQGSMTND